MSQVQIVHLESYRSRRESRYRRVQALYGHERHRSAVLEHLWRAADLAGADRAAVVWLDEYGPGLARPHTLLDLASDRPRRAFSPGPLRIAWDTRVPGFLDLCRREGGRDKLGEGIASACAVALGSDGPRSWFLVVDSLTPRAALSQRTVETLMFLAGEISAIVLHQDLDFPHRGDSLGLEDPNESAAQSKAGSFSGWPVLRDLEGREGDQAASRIIGNRFLVARLVKGLLEDDLVALPESVASQVRAVRTELGPLSENHPEVPIWARVLDAVSAMDYARLLTLLLEWGRAVEQQGHVHGALEILSMAYAIAQATASSGAAADAARFRAKIFRVRAEWSRALAWYDIARRVAEESGNRRKLAAVLDGLANAYRDRGNLPRAREILQQVMEVGEGCGDRYALAIAHHDLMTVEKLSGNLVAAIQHGWLAVQSYDSRDGSLRALFDLAGVLRERGELSAAWDAYTVVVDQVKGLEARVLALDALAYIAALKGDQNRHDAIRARMDGEKWEEISQVYLGQVLFYRGLSCRALGDEDQAERWLNKALSLAEENSLNKLIFDVEAALEAGPATSLEGEKTPSPPQDPVPEEILGVRQGLREMREALVTADMLG